MPGETGIEAEYVQLLADYQLEVPSYPSETRDSIESWVRLLQPRLVGDQRESMINTVFAMSRSGRPGILKRRVEEVVRWVSSAGLVLRHEVFAGEFPTGSINAHVRAAKAGALILVNTGLVSFIHAFFRVMSLAASFVDRDRSTAVGGASVSNEESELMLAELALGYLLNRRELIRTHVEIGTEQGVWITMMSYYCQQFVVAHEIGHIIAGHIESPRYVTTRTPVGDLQTIQKGWEREFAADQVAARLFLEAMPKVIDDPLKWYESQFVLAGPLIFLQLDEFLTNVWSRLRDSSYPPPMDHPPSHLRVDAISEYYRLSGISGQEAILASHAREWLASRQAGVLRALEKIV